MKLFLSNKSMFLLFIAVMTGASGFAGAQTGNSSKANVLIQGLPQSAAPVTRELRNIKGLTVRNIGELKEVWSVPKDQQEKVMQRLREVTSRKGGSIAALSGDYRNLLSVVPSTRDLQPEQQKLFLAIRDSVGNQQVSLVEMAPAALASYALVTGFDKRDTFATPGSLKIQVSSDKTFTLVKDASQLSEGGYVWRGHTQNSGGEALLVVNGSSISGTIRDKNQIYSIRPVGNGLHAVIEKVTKDFPPEHPPSFSEREKDASGLRDLPAPESLKSDAAVEINLLVAYTPAVAALYADVNNDLVGASIASMNETFSRSGLPNLKVRLAHSYKVNYPERANWDEHLKLLVGEGDGVMDEIHQLRTDHKTDAVVLLMNDSRYCGEAREIMASRSTAFAVVYHGCANDYFSFAHEIGHLFGARHDRCVDDTKMPFRYGHGYVDSAKQWRTIMAYGHCCDNCQRKGLWSSPDLKIDGRPAGTADDEFNVRVLREQAKRLADFE